MGFVFVGAGSRECAWALALVKRTLLDVGSMKSLGVALQLRTFISLLNLMVREVGYLMIQDGIVSLGWCDMPRLMMMALYRNPKGYSD